MWFMSVKGAWPIHGAPSPPIWNSAFVLRSGNHTAMPWQPMPPIAIEPSGTLVDVLCGHPAQKLGRRTRLVALLAAITPQAFGFR